MNLDNHQSKFDNDSVNRQCSVVELNPYIPNIVP